MKICKIHGQLNADQIILNRYSPKGKAYYRCKICRRDKEINRKDRTIYLYTKRKHLKNKVPKFVTHENKPHAYTILHKFKMTANHYYDLLEKQNHVCKICKKPETQIKKKSNKVKMLSVDHCHKTGKIRGLLCFKCNIGIGAFNDDIELMKSGIEYLKATNQ
jgi:hypothetical protein